jgi:hypothetical protein
MVKAFGGQRESEGVVVPLIGVQHNAPGGKGPCFDHVHGVGKREGMTGSAWSNSPGKSRLAVAGEEPLCPSGVKVRELQRALWAAGRQYVDTALRRIDELTTEIGPVRGQLINFARRQVGCRALQARQYGVGWLCTAVMWAEIGDARRFDSSDQLVRFAGLDVTVYSSDGKRSPGHLSRQGSPELRWATFEAAKCAARHRFPDYAYYHKLAAAPDSDKNPTLAVERKILRRSYHTLRELGDAALARPVPEIRRMAA